MERHPVYTTGPVDFRHLVKLGKAEHGVQAVSDYLLEKMLGEEVDEHTRFRLIFEEALDHRLGYYVLMQLYSILKRGKMPKDGLLWVGVDRAGEIYLAAGEQRGEWRKVA